MNDTKVKEQSFVADSLGIREIDIKDEAAFASDAECTTTCN